MSAFRNVFAACLMSLLALSTAQADEIDEAQVVIENQINAFLSDDAETAYSFASPGIRTMYPDSARFFEMVKRGYSPVYRPGNFAFGRAKPSDDGATVVQEVIISGPDGQDWTAIYLLEKQSGGNFTISGVQMLKTASPQT